MGLLDFNRTRCCLLRELFSSQMISRKDLVLTQHTERSKRLLVAIPVTKLLYLVKQWFNVPELRPTHETAEFDVYKELRNKKADVIERILKEDWVT